METSKLDKILNIFKTKSFLVEFLTTPFGTENFQFILLFNQNNTMKTLFLNKSKDEDGDFYDITIFNVMSHFFSDGDKSQENSKLYFYYEGETHPSIPEDSLEKKIKIYKRKIMQLLYEDIFINKDKKLIEQWKILELEKDGPEFENEKDLRFLGRTVLDHIDVISLIFKKNEEKKEKNESHQDLNEEKNESNQNLNEEIIQNTIQNLDLNEKLKQ